MLRSLPPLRCILTAVTVAPALQPVERANDHFSVYSRNARHVLSRSDARRAKTSSKRSTVGRASVWSVIIIPLPQHNQMHCGKRQQQTIAAAAATTTITTTTATTVAATAMEAPLPLRPHQPAAQASGKIRLTRVIPTRTSCSRRHRRRLLPPRPRPPGRRVQR